MMEMVAVKGLWECLVCRMGKWMDALIGLAAIVILHCRHHNN
jgi:hypothetical protein